jgi:hypothetical protein
MSTGLYYYTAYTGLFISHLRPECIGACFDCQTSLGNKVPIILFASYIVRTWLPAPAVFVLLLGLIRLFTQRFAAAAFTACLLARLRTAGQ